MKRGRIMRKIIMYFDECYKPQANDLIYLNDPSSTTKFPESLLLPEWLRILRRQGYVNTIRRDILLMIKNKRLSCEELPHVKI